MRFICIRSCECRLSLSRPVPKLRCWRVTLQQFAVLIGQIQAPEDVRPAPPPPAAARPQATAPPQAPSPAANTVATQQTEDAPQEVTPSLPTLGTTRPNTTAAPPPRFSVMRALFVHMQNDPSARMCKPYTSVIAQLR